MQGEPQKPEVGNLIAAMLLSVAVLIGWEYFFAGPQRDAAVSQQARSDARHPDSVRPDLPDSAAPDANTNETRAAVSRDERLQAAPRIPIRTGSLQGSINLTGGRIDDLVLRNYRQEVEEDSPPVVLLSPSGLPSSYFAEFGWLSRAGITVPTDETRWQTKATQLTAAQPVTLYWENEQGIRFERIISVDTFYMFTIRQRVINSSGSEIMLYPYGVISRNYADKGQHFFILHEGPLGVFNETLEEVDYETLREDGRVAFDNRSGWVGITDKYWLTALVPDRNLQVNATMKYVQGAQGDRYQVDFTAPGQAIQAGSIGEVTHSFFAGAKRVGLLDDYAKERGIPLFDRAVDFGWLYFLTKPIFVALQFFNQLLGNFGLAILALTVCIKLLLFPLANKSYKAMGQLKQLMPKIQQIKEQYADDRMAMNQAIMQLYQQEKVNPASGCVPLLIQIPIFFSLYKVLFVTIEMRHAPFYGWIQDLSAPDPTSVFTLFGLIPLDLPGFLQIGAWPIIMCITMIIQMRLNPKPADPAQAMVMQWLPFVFLFLFASFPAGLVIYWAWNNALSILQQWVIMKRHGRR